MYWQDELLVWRDLTDFRDIKRLHIPASKIWIPDIGIHNA